jgi:hypothetical protein
MVIADHVEEGLSKIQTIIKRVSYHLAHHGQEIKLMDSVSLINADLQIKLT